jgi:vitamin K-dependent gamma-carboxylase
MWMVDLMNTSQAMLGTHVSQGFCLSSTIKSFRQPVAGQSVAVLRISLGLTISLWAVHYLISGRAEILCEPGRFHFTYPGFAWVRPWPGNGTVIQFWIIAFSGLALAAGLATRVSAVVAAFAFTHFFLIDRTSYQNHYYLMLLLCWWMAILPVGRCGSVDAEAGDEKHPRTVPFLVVFLLRFHVALPYIFGGLAKIETDWLQGTPMRLMLMHRMGLDRDSGLLDVSTVCLAWGGLLFDLLIVPGLLFRRTRVAAIVAMTLFHLTNAWLFPIHVFPWLMLAASTIFFSPDWPKKVYVLFWSRVLSAATSAEPADLPKIQPVGAISMGDNADAAAYSVEQRTSCVKPMPALWRCQAVLVAAYCLFHVLWPLRSHLLEGNPNWTERGHFFSWRMMLRGKIGTAEFSMRNPADGKLWKADYSRLLNPEQAARFALDPEMILQFARHLAVVHSDRTGVFPEVYVVARASLNGRAPQLLIDPQVNLAAQSPQGLTEKWILCHENVAESTLRFLSQKTSAPLPGHL